MKIRLLFKRWKGGPVDQLDLFLDILPREGESLVLEKSLDLKGPVSFRIIRIIHNPEKHLIECVAKPYKTLPEKEFHDASGE